MSKDKPSVFILGRLRQEYLLTHTGKSFPSHLGGPATYASCGACVWEADVHLVSRLWPAAFIEPRDVLFHQGINTDAIREVATYELDPVFFHQQPDGVILDHHPAKHYLSYQQRLPKHLIEYQSSTIGEDETRQLTPATLQPDDLGNLLFSDAAIHLAAGHYLTHATLPLQLRERGGAMITLEASPAYMNPSFQHEVRTLVQGLDAFITNEQSCRSYFRRESLPLEEMVITLGNMGAKHIVIQCDDQHKLLWDQAQQVMWSIPYYSSHQVSRIGAEHVFCGGFVAGLLLTGDPVEAALRGVVAESMACEGYGPWYATGAHPELAPRRLGALRGRVTKVRR